MVKQRNDFAGHMARMHARLFSHGLSFRDYQEIILLCGEPGLDWLEISAELDRLDLLPFTSVCLALCERWYGMKSPLLRAYLTERFYQTVTETIRRDGSCGPVPMIHKQSAEETYRYYAEHARDEVMMTRPL